MPHIHFSDLVHNKRVTKVGGFVSVFFSRKCKNVKFESVGKEGTGCWDSKEEVKRIAGKE